MSLMKEEDVEALIEEIEKRPALYDKSLKDYSNILIKKKLWEEICPMVVTNWSDLPAENKTKASLDVQKKWQSLRNCFARELRNQKGVTSGQSAKKRRKYIYFDKLLFLLPTIENRDTLSILDENNDDEYNEHGADDTTDNERNRKEYRGKPKAKNTSTFEQSLLDILQSHQESKKEDNEDVHFALSLVPMISSLNEYQKIEAKIQILSVLRSLKFGTSSLQTPASPSTPSTSHVPSLKPKITSNIIIHRPKPTPQEYEYNYECNDSYANIRVRPSSSLYETSPSIDNSNIQSYIEHFTDSDNVNE